MNTTTSSSILSEFRTRTSSEIELPDLNVMCIMPAHGHRLRASGVREGRALRRSVRADQVRAHLLHAVVPDRLVLGHRAGSIGNARIPDSPARQEYRGDVFADVGTDRGARMF